MKGTRVIIVGDHPHRGETGTLTGKVVNILGTGPDMYEVDLDDSVTDGCFAQLQFLRKLPKDADKSASLGI